MMRMRERVGSEVRVAYVLQRPQYREGFLQLMAELRTVTRDLLASVGANPNGYWMEERPDRDGWFVEVIRFGSDEQRSRFDDLYSQDRRASALQGLLDELVDAARSDYVLMRPPSHREPTASRSGRTVERVV
jgi:hypothetical protein